MRKYFIFQLRARVTRNKEIKVCGLTLRQYIVQSLKGHCPDCAHVCLAHANLKNLTTNRIEIASTLEHTIVCIRQIAIVSANERPYLRGTVRLRSLVPRPCVGAEARMSFSSTGSGSVPPIVGGTGAVNQDVIMFGEQSHYEGSNIVSVHG